MSEYNPTGENQMTLNIDDLTLGQIKQIQAMCGATQTPRQQQHPFVGRYVLCRCYSAGVHTGELVSANGDEVILKNSRRLWSWTAEDGVALSGVAQNGLKGGNVDTVNPDIALTGVIEIIPCSDKARESINGS